MTTLASRRPTSLRQALPALIALSLAMLVEMVDNSLLNVALPSIGRALGASATDLQWFIGAYALAFGSLLLLGGTLGDRLGRRRTMLVGLVLFGLAGLAVLVVATPAQLIAVRAAGGACAALIAPITGSLIYSLFDDDVLRRRGITIIVTIAVLGSMTGPILAGLALKFVPWHVLLLVNAPIALLAFLGVAYGVPKDDPATLTSGRVDLLGAALSAAGLAGLLCSVTLATEHGWASWPALSCAGFGAAALVVFIRHELRVDRPLLDPRLFRIPTVSGSILLQTAAMLAMVAVSFLATELFQFAWGWSALKAGFATMPLVAGMMIGTPLVEAGVRRFGHRRVAAGGSGLIVVALVLVMLGISHGYLVLATGFLALSFGLAAVMTTCTVALLGALPAERVSVGQALGDTAQELGNAVGVAVVGTVVATMFAPVLPQGRWQDDQVAAFDHALVAALVVITVIVAGIAAWGVRTLSNSREVDEG